MMQAYRLRPAIVCLAAGKSQLIVIEKAKELGLSVIAVDRDPNAPGFALSDEKIELSTYDATPIINKLYSLKDKYKLIGVVNRASGPPVVTAAKICQVFELPGVPPKSASIIVNKSQLMAACSGRGIATPACQAVSSLEDINYEHLDLPCIVKPSLSLVGKKGVRLVLKKDSLPEAFMAACQAAMNGIVNVEEFVPGRDVSLMGVVVKGQLHCITLLDELNVTDSNGNIKGVGFAIPSVFSGQPEEASIIGMAKKIVDSFKLDTTAFNMSCRCESRGTPRLVEIHLDLGGDLILDALIPESTSFDVLEFMFRALTGEKPVLQNITFNPVAVIFGEGEGMVSERPYNILTAQDRTSLERSLLLTQRQIYGQNIIFGL
ncbi:MAG: ATP-grasp domain protein [Parcubacteria group bacterium GW2011_GWC2_42_12]|nr:MAG: ATP-grasp domain protein [Parcubacteria group bacterium GW2011_GWC2_42_12]